MNTFSIVYIGSITGCLMITFMKLRYCYKLGVQEIMKDGGDEKATIQRVMDAAYSRIQREDDDDFAKLLLCGICDIKSSIVTMTPVALFMAPFTLMGLIYMTIVSWRFSIEKPETLEEMLARHTPEQVEKMLSEVKKRSIKSTINPEYLALEHFNEN